MAPAEKPQNRKIPLKDGRQLTLAELRKRVKDAEVRDLPEIRFVELLVATKVLGIDDISAFVQRARSAQISLPQQAVNSQLLTDDDLAMCYSRLYNIPAVRVTGPPEADELTDLIDLAQAQRLGVLPLRRDESGLVVAVSDPEIANLADELAGMAGMPVSLRVASSQAIRDALAALSQAKDTTSEDLEREIRAETVQVDIRGGGGDSTITVLADAVIAQAAEQGASDIHIEPSAGNTRVRYRIDGVLTEARIVPRAVHDNLVTRIKVISDLKIDERRSPQDGRASFKVPGGKSIDLRVATLPTVHGERVTMRILDPSQSKMGLNELGLHGSNLGLVQSAVARPHGMCITTGPTGSGKSTTLYAMLHTLNETSRNVITVEDPVEQRVEGLQQVQTNERAKLTFASALRSILRSDPDVIMIGEIRDFETAKIAVESAMTGHLVLSTLHTNSAVAAIARFTEMGVEPFLIADACHLIIAQRLARTLCQYCKQEREVDEAMLSTANAPSWVKERLDPHTGTLQMFQSQDGGCVRCRGTGYRGRMGIHEVLEVSPELSEMIMQGASADQIEARAIEQGMRTLRDDGYAKILDGRSTIEEISRVTTS